MEENLKVRTATIAACVVPWDCSDVAGLWMMLPRRRRRVLLHRYQLRRQCQKDLVQLRRG